MQAKMATNDKTIRRHEGQAPKYRGTFWKLVGGTKMWKKGVLEYKN